MSLSIKMYTHHTTMACGEVLVEGYDEDGNEEHAALLDALVKESGAQRGDVIRSASREDSDRNQGIIGIFDGKKVVLLDTEVDDYGALPNEFGTIGEFPPCYWEDQIDHNQFVWIHEPRRFMNQLIEQFNDKNETPNEDDDNNSTYSIDEYGSTVVLEHEGKRYKLVYDHQYNSPQYGCCGNGTTSRQFIYDKLSKTHRDFTVSELVEKKLKESAVYKYCMMLKEFSGTEPVLCSYIRSYLHNSEDSGYAGTVALGYYN